MSDILNRSFIDLLPPNLQDDPESIAVGKAFDEVFRAQYSKLTTKPLIYCNIDNLEHEVLDVLAPDSHVDVYDTNWSLEKKRQACKNSQDWHLYKGTPYVLEDVAKSLIGTAEIQEWDKYNGLSQHFKVIFNIINDSFDQLKISELEQITNKYKNLRSKVDAIEFSTVSKADLKVVPITTIDEVIFIPNKFVPLVWDSDDLKWTGDVETENDGYWSR